MSSVSGQTERRFYHEVSAGLGGEGEQQISQSSAKAFKIHRKEENFFPDMRGLITNHSPVVAGTVTSALGPVTDGCHRLSLARFLKPGQCYSTR